MLKVRKGDLVQVITGADRGKQGKVLAVDPTAGRIRVAGVRMQKRHLRPGRRGARQGGIVEQEGFVQISNVMLVNPADGKPSRVRISEEAGGRVRVFARGGQPVADPTRV